MPPGSGTFWGSCYGGRGGDTSVRHVLSGGGPVSPPFWGGELSFVRGDVLEARGGPCDFPMEDNGA